MTLLLSVTLTVTGLSNTAFAREVSSGDAEVITRDEFEDWNEEPGFEMLEESDEVDVLGENSPLELTEEEIAIYGASAVDGGNCGDNLRWILQDDGTLTISGSGPMYDYVDYGPWHWSVYPYTKLVIAEGVTTIGNLAFRGCTSLTAYECAAICQFKR